MAQADDDKGQMQLYSAGVRLDGSDTSIHGICNNKTGLLKLHYYLRSPELAILQSIL